MEQSHRADNQDVKTGSVPLVTTELMTLSNSSATDHRNRKQPMPPQTRTSLRKVNANRRNAQKSTGPRTARGKAAVRFNPLKHGFLSKQVVISSKHIQESTEDFQALVAECWDYFQPIGRPEELLVEQIAVCFWNSRRTIRCELGEVGKSVQLDEEQFQAKQDDFTAFRLAFKVSTLETAKSEIRTQGKLSDRTMSNIQKDFGKYVISEPEHWVCKASDVEEWKASLVQKIEEYIQWWGAMLVNAEGLERSEAEARKERLALPRAEALERIMRYQAANERRLHRSLAELERLQRQRKGEYVPPPVKVAVDGAERD